MADMRLMELAARPSKVSVARQDAYLWTVGWSAIYGGHGG